MVLSNELSCEAGSLFCLCISHRFFQAEVLRLSFSYAGTLARVVCPTAQLFLPGYLHPNVGLSIPPAATLLCVLSALAAHLHPSYHLGEYFFFNSLVVSLPHSSIIWQFWLFLFVNLLLSFFWLWEEAKYIYLLLHLCWKSHFLKLLVWRVFLLHSFTQRICYSL